MVYMYIYIYMVYMVLVVIVIKRCKSCSLTENPHLGNKVLKINKKQLKDGL